MATTRVRPGEIISSELINFLLQKIDELEDKVDSLGGFNRIRIAEFSPEEGTPVGEFMQVVGANFLHPPADNLVLVAGKAVQEFSSPSTSKILTFRVPESITITDEEGEPVTVSISNEQFGSTEATYTLFPAAEGEAPIIDTVVSDTGSTILNTGRAAVINGENFASDPPNNEISFEIVVGSERITYSVPDEDIDAPNSDEQKIQFTVPDIREIPLNQQRPVTLRVKVASRTAIKEGVPVRRMAA